MNRVIFHALHHFVQMPRSYFDVIQQHTQISGSSKGTCLESQPVGIVRESFRVVIGIVISEEHVVDHVGDEDLDRITVQGSLNLRIRGGSTFAEV